MVSPPLFSWTSTPTMQFVVNVMNQKVICHDNNQLLAFGTRMLPPPGGLLTRLSMVVALVFGRCMLTYGMWQWGHTGAAGRTILMMSTKKERWAAKRSTVCQDLSLCKKTRVVQELSSKTFLIHKTLLVGNEESDRCSPFRQRPGNSLWADYYSLFISDKTEHFQTVLHGLSILPEVLWQFIQKAFLCLQIVQKVQTHLKVGLLIWHYGLKMQCSSMSKTCLNKHVLRWNYISTIDLYILETSYIYLWQNLFKSVKCEMPCVCIL